jgi:hypothetical protein
MTLTQLTSLVYIAHRAYAGHLGEDHPRWDDLPEPERALWRKSVRYQVANPQAPPEAVQDEWLRLESDAGWGYGPRLDVARKRHPRHIPWEALAPEHKVKVEMVRDVIRDVMRGNSITPDAPETA